MKNGEVVLYINKNSINSKDEVKIIYGDDDKMRWDVIDNDIIK